MTTLITVTITPIVGVFLIFFILLESVNILMYDKWERMTKYKLDHFKPSGNTFKILFFFGVLVVLFFRQVMKDARYLHFLSKQKDDIISHIYGSLGTKPDKENELLLTQRSLKLLKIKYKRKKFVIRKIFHIFVGI